MALKALISENQSIEASGHSTQAATLHFNIPKDSSVTRSHDLALWNPNKGLECWSIEDKTRTHKELRNVTMLLVH